MSAGAASASPVPSITSSTVHHAGSCTARGDFAICDAAGNAWHPFRIRVHVHASPDQHVSVSWERRCVSKDQAPAAGPAASLPGRRLTG